MGACFHVSSLKCPRTLFLQVGTRHAVSEHPWYHPLPWRTRHAVSLQVIICTLSSVICYLYSIHFLPLSQGEYHEVGRGYDVSFTFHFSLSAFYFLLISYPLPLRVCPRVALGSAPLRGHRMTFSHSSKDPLLPLSQGEKVSGHLTPET